MTSATLTAQAVADLVGGRLLGQGAASIGGVAALDRAGPGTLSFLASARYLSQFRSSRAGAVLLREEHAGEAQGPSTRIVVGDPGRAILLVIERLFPAPPVSWVVDSTARIGEGTTFAGDVSIGPHAVVGKDVRLGARCRVGPGAIIEDGVVIGDDSDIGAYAVCHRGARLGRRVRLKAGAVIGADGFGFLPDRDGLNAIPHVGACILEDDVQVGSNSCVDRGSIDDTVIGAGTKIDNLVHVAHNCRIGRGCLLMAGVGLAGSARVGDGVILAGQVGVGDHVTIGDRARVGGQAGVTGDVPPGTDVSGYPARAHREFLRGQAALYRVARIIDDLESLVTKRGHRG